MQSASHIDAKIPKSPRWRFSPYGTVSEIGGLLGGGIFLATWGGGLPGVIIGMVVGYLAANESETQRRNQRRKDDS